MHRPQCIKRHSVERKISLKDVSAYSKVVSALVLHDIKSIFFGNGLGQIMMIAWPIAHIAVLLCIYSFSNRAVPFGRSSLLYCVTGLMPFIIFSYASRWIVYATVQNKPFMQYPIVQCLDLMLARAVLEMVSACVVTAAIIIALSASGVDCWPADVLQASFAFGTSFLVAVGMGLINGAISSVIPQWVTVYSIAIIVFYATSGVLFISRLC